MAEMKKKIIVIVGPTASGKSEFAVRLAKKLKGEIISADSRQVYRGLDIGTGKVAGKWKTLKGFIHPPYRIPRDLAAGMKGNFKSLPRGPIPHDKVGGFIYQGVPHHCIDFVSPKKTFTVAEYKKCAEQALDNIIVRKLMPIVVGGTGFWIDTLVYNLNLPAVRPNHKLRKKLEKKSAGELLKILQKSDPERARTIEQKNPRRLIRAIEIAQVLGKIPKLAKKNSPYNITWIGLNPPIKILSEHIKKRTAQMLRRGLAAETKKLLRQGISKKRLHELGFEYRATLKFIEKKITQRELYEKLVGDTLAYARRQMTWWKNNPHIQWINPLSHRSRRKR